MSQLATQMQFYDEPEPTEIQLRPHQELAIEQLRFSLAKGFKRVLLAAPCSFGKTIVAVSMLLSSAKKGNRGIFICDRVKLVQQTLAAFDRAGIHCGVIQGQHERSDPHAKIQIASIQTLSRRQRLPEFSFAIVDEAHTHYESLTKIMTAYNNIPFIGLSATPYSKGLGKVYQDLIIPITPTELLDQGYLCPVRYYGGASVDVSGIKSKRLATGGSDYDPSSIAQATEDDTTLVGDIIQNWLLHGENSQTIAFCPSIKHSKWLVAQFNQAGIPAAHIDGYMDPEQRDFLYRGHDAGDFKILSCSQLMNTGYDAPQVKCLIDCYPTKSKIVFQQRGGRIMRTHPSKDYSIYLDHAGNVARHGFGEHIVPESLDDGTQTFDERNQVKEKKEPKTRNCPKCQQIMVGLKCVCGYEIHLSEQIESTGGELIELESKKVKATKESKQEFYSGLIHIANASGYADGWIAHTYRDYFGVWPRSLLTVSAKPSKECTGFVMHKRIKNAKRRAVA